MNRGTRTERSGPLMAVDYVLAQVPADQLQVDDRILMPRGGTRIVGQLQHWDRWDGQRMVTVIDTDRRGLAARESWWLFTVERWPDELAEPERRIGPLPAGQPWPEDCF